MTQLDTLIADLIPADLIQDVTTSLQVPQCGPFHQEGPLMDSHLQLVLDTIDDISIYHDIDTRVPTVVRDLMIGAVKSVGVRVCALYVLLHDIDKANCLTLVYSDKKVAVTWAEWTQMYDGSDLDEFCTRQGIEQISYYQELDGETRKHGHVAAERLAGRDDIPAIVVTAIDEHELAFTFGSRGGINIPLIESMVEGKDDVAVGFIFAVNYCDAMGSYSVHGEPDLSDFLLMAESYMAHRAFVSLSERLAATDGLDQHQLGKLLPALRKATDAFQSETADEAYERIVAATALPEVTEDQVREALAPAIADGLSEELVTAIVEEMVRDGKLGKDTGKQLGRFNRTVRPALAQLG